MVVGAVAEVLSLGAVLPFLAVLTDPAAALCHPARRRVGEGLGDRLA